MGVVYRAHDDRLNRDVALKILPPDSLIDENQRRKFRIEALTLSALNHPNIATVHDFDSQEGVDFLVTELITGAGLDTILERGPLSENEVLRLGAQMAEALAAAHGQNIIHRDLKPANLRLTSDGRLKVLDFGLAKLVQPVAEALTETANNAAAGTLPYMSPEQLRGDPLDPRTDIWGAGAVMYEMATGRQPFAAKTTSALSGEILHSSVVPPRRKQPGLSPRLDDIIVKCLEKDPENRYQSAKELLVDLRRLASPTAVVGVPGRTPSHRVLAVATIAAALVVAAVILWIAWQSGSHGLPNPEYVPVTSFADAASWPAISPDGRMLAFTRDDGNGSEQVYIKLLPNGDPVQLTRDALGKSNIAFTPDGTRIAYTTVSNWSWDTWTIPVLGGEPSRLLANASGLTWISPGRVMFSEITQGLYMKIATAAESRADERDVYLPPNSEIAMAHESALSPDGKWVLVAEMDNRGWLPCRLVPFDKPSRGTAVGPANSKCTNARFSPDGKWMYFSADAGAGYHLWRQRFPGGQPEQITFGATEEQGLAVSPDGRSLFTSIGNEQSTVWYHSSGGDKQVTSEGYAFTPAFSPDGTKLFYLLRSGSSRSFITGELWAADLSSGRAEKYFPGFLITRFDISPDGQRVVFAAVNKSEKSTIWLARLDGRSPPRQLTSEEAYRPLFDHSGGVVYVGKENDQDYIFRINEDGAARRKIFPNPVIYLINMSPDRQWIVAWVERPGEELPQAVVAYPVSGGAGKVLCTGCGTGPSNVGTPVVAWSQDQSVLYFRPAVRMGGPSIVLIPLPRGAAFPTYSSKMLSDSLKDVPGLRSVGSNIFPGPNPSTYAFTRITSHRNIYRVDFR